MKVVDLFSGVGGLSLGFHMSGFETALAVEYHKGIAEGYSLNFPNVDVINQDINEIDLKALMSSLRGSDYILIGGPPCQGFSQKGMRKGLDDSRNFMFVKYIEAVRFLKPKALVIENVPGLLTVENGFFYSEIKAALESCGYNLYHNVLDASKFGVPQTRKRAFIVGFLGNMPSFKWPIAQEKMVTVNEALSDLPRLKSGEGKDEMEYDASPSSDYQQLMRRNSEVLYNHKSTRHSDLVLERLSLIPEDGGREDLPEEHLTKSVYSGTWCRLPKNGIARTITTRYDTPSSGMFTLPDQDRCLTTREAARIQSFPDAFRFVGNKSTQMLQVGNAVPPLLSFAVANQIKYSLG